MLVMVDYNGVSRLDWPVKGFQYPGVLGYLHYDSAHNQALLGASRSDIKDRLV